jgi:hypothetical protein
MSLLGKVFAILNVFAAIGFAVLVGLDWGQRQRWEYAVYRHDLMVRGFPIDNKETDPDGTLRVDRLSDYTSDQILNSVSVPGRKKGVKTQMEELEQVRNAVKAKIDDAAPWTPVEQEPPLTTREQKLAYFLIPLARTYAEREALVKLRFGEKPNKPEETLKPEELDARLTAAFNEANEGGPHQRPLDERKQVIARLLLCFSETLEPPTKGDPTASNSYKRFLAIAGLDNAQRALNTQALIQQQLAEQVLQAYAADRTQFTADTTRQIYDLLNLADNLKFLNDMLTAAQEQVLGEQKLVNAREEAIEQLKKQRQEENNKVAELLKHQAKLEAEVINRLRALRDTGKTNLEMEKRIRELERAVDAGTQKTEGK